MSEVNILLENCKDENEKIVHKENESISVVNIEEETQIVKPEKEKTRICWADCLRVFSMFSIVLLHSANNSYEKTLANLKNRNFIIVCIYNSITRFAVPVFVMLSGMFFLNPNKKFSFSKLIKKNILRLITAFIFWSAINAFINIMRPKTRPSILSLEFIKQFLILFIPGEEYLWFIMMIIGCYLCIPILRRIVDDKIVTIYFLGLWIVWGSIFPSIEYTLNRVGASTVASVFTTWESRWNFNFTLGYTGYFVAGYFIFKYVNIENLRHRIILYILGIIDLIVIITVCSILGVETGTSFTYLRENLVLTDIFYSFVVFVFFKYEIGKIQFSEKTIKIITKLSSLTFGMYLSHMVLRNILFNELNFTHDHIGKNIHYSPAIGIPILFIIVSSASLLLSYIVSYIPILKNYVI